MSLRLNDLVFRRKPVSCWRRCEWQHPWKLIKMTRRFTDSICVDEEATLLSMLWSSFSIFEMSLWTVRPYDAPLAPSSFSTCIQCRRNFTQKKIRSLPTWSLGSALRVVPPSTQLCGVWISGLAFAHDQPLSAHDQRVSGVDLLSSKTTCLYVK